MLLWKFYKEKNVLLQNSVATSSWVCWELFSMYKAGLFSPPQENHAGQQNQKINKKQHFENLQNFQTDRQAQSWNPLKRSNNNKKKGKWVNYQNFTFDDTMYLPFLTLFSLNLQEPQIRNTTQRTWKLTNSVATKHFLYPYEVFSHNTVILLWNWNICHIFSFRSC